jgi:hypothetical protein
MLSYGTPHRCDRLNMLQGCHYGSQYHFWAEVSVRTSPRAGNLFMDDMMEGFCSREMSAVIYKSQLMMAKE